MSSERTVPVSTVSSLTPEEENMSRESELKKKSLSDIELINRGEYYGKRDTMSRVERRGVPWLLLSASSCTIWQH